MNEANKIADPAKRETALRAARDSEPKGTRRLFAGKGDDRAAMVSLADAEGARIRMRVEAGGAAAIEFLDESGKVTTRLPP